MLHFILQNNVTEVKFEPHYSHFHKGAELPQSTMHGVNNHILKGKSTKADNWETV